MTLPHMLGTKDDMQIDRADATEDLLKNVCPQNIVEVYLGEGSIMQVEVIEHVDLVLKLDLL